MRRLLASKRRPDRGQGLAEFAIVLPVFLLLLFGLIDVGRGVFLYNDLTNAAREGARLAIVNQEKSLIAQRVQALTFAGTISNLGNLDDLDPLSLVTFRRSGPDSKDPLKNEVCASPDVGCIAVVRARADWSLFTPIASSIIGTLSLEARSEMPIEYTCPSAYTSTCPRQP
jgi:Flp pilus assembly protein TadG